MKYNQRNSIITELGELQMNGLKIIEQIEDK